MFVKVAIPRLRLRTQRLEEKKHTAFASLTNYLRTYVKRAAHLARKEKRIAEEMEYCLRNRDDTKRLEGCMLGHDKRDPQNNNECVEQDET